MHCINLVILEFASVAQLSDGEIYQKMLVTCKSATPQLFPRGIRWDSYRVTRTPKSIVVHLLAAKHQLIEPEEIARFSFISRPDLARV